MDNNAMAKQVTITLRGKEVIARFPNIGQSLKIEQMKQLLTDGRYAIMAFSGLKTTNKMLDLVEAICYLSNSVEDFYGVLGVNSHIDIMNMDFSDGIPRQLLEQYQEVYEPFYNSWEERTDRPIKQAKKVVELSPEELEKANTEAAPSAMENPTASNQPAEGPIVVEKPATTGSHPATPNHSASEEVQPVQPQSEGPKANESQPQT